MSPTVPKLTSYVVALGRSATTGGNYEWYLTLDGVKILPPSITVGVITTPTADTREALRMVLASWGRFGIGDPASGVVDLGA
jgi:hypothetical protein